MYKRTEKGITLVALVITIIVLLILAGVTLRIVFNGGIIDKSQNAIDQYAYQSKNEEEQLADFERWMEQYFDIKSGDGPTSIVVDNTNGNKNRSAIESEDPSCQNPVIPVGFKTMDTEDAKWETSDGEIVDNWNKGLVISDAEGNEFVWVPAQLPSGSETGITEYKKYYSNYTDDTLPSGVEDEEDQIGTYGGFYIARYEAGTTLAYSSRNIIAKPLSKPNQIPWNNIDYDNAKASAESMYNNSDYVQSGLVTGRMWDTTLMWLINSEALTEYEVISDSGTWGNYYNAPVSEVTWYLPYEFIGSNEEWTKLATETTKPTENTQYYGEDLWIIRTGNTEYTKRGNIYDLAGNVSEYLNEIDSFSDRVYRGGNFYLHSSYSPAAYRYIFSASSASSYISFRVGLYISSTEN